MTTPLVLLDVDGVINDLGHLGGHRRPWQTRIISTGGFQVHIPDFMPSLIQSIAAVAEIHWCTTWRESANTEIAPLLGVGPFPVVTDGTDSHWVDWKAASAYGVASDAIAAERRVIWIEDFYGEIPESEMPPGVEYIDTAEVPGGAVLIPELVPDGLISD